MAPSGFPGEAGRAMVERTADAGCGRLGDLALRWQRSGCPKTAYEARHAPGDFQHFRDVVRAELVAANPEAKDHLLELATLLQLATSDIFDLLWRIPREEKPIDQEIVFCLDPLVGPPYRGWRRGPHWRRHTPPSFRFMMDLPCVVAFWMPDLGIVPPADSRERLRSRN